MEKLEILKALADIETRSVDEIKRLHSALCFVRAFPDTGKHFQEARRQLLGFDNRVRALSRRCRERLDDSGIAGTLLYYAFSYEVAVWMARRLKGAVSIDWVNVDNTSRLDELLESVLLHCEADYFDSGLVSSEEWLGLVSSADGAREFEWLIRQLRQGNAMAAVQQSYNAADIPLVLDLKGSAYSKSRNTLPVRKIHTREAGMRRPHHAVKSEISRPVGSVKLLPRNAGSQLIDVAMASLAVRHRETYHFNFANPAEVYLADVGQGVSIGVFGLLPGHRFALECTMGFLILSNGSPVGYGGASAVFRQVNTGLNIFDEFRGSEAAFLWVQVMRVFRHIVGCNRFIANPYQLGNDNTEALRSGAFWFYYRLGYRPCIAEIKALALQERLKMRNDRAYRSDLRTLRRLSSCDMHLVLTGARASELFEERWIETSSMLATRVLAAAGGSTRQESMSRVASSVTCELGLRSCENWPLAEKRAFLNLAPFVAAANPADWSSESRRQLRKVVKAKGGGREANFARLLGQHETFLSELRKACRRAEHA